MAKKSLRAEMQQKRKQAQIAYAQSATAQNNLCENFKKFLDNLTITSPTTDSNARRARRNPLCAGYLSMRYEIDPRPLMRIYEQRYKNTRQNVCLLPVVIANDAPLLFRIYDGNENSLIGGAFATKHPPQTAGEAKPSLLLVPLLAFDRRCKRLGYGGGFYDRSIARLRENSQKKNDCKETNTQQSSDTHIFALGLAFEAQLVDNVPSEPHDLALDAVLTEQRLYRTAL